MTVSLEDVKRLRALTGAGMGNCKKALEESNNDFKAAIIWLRAHGLAAAGKRSGKAANEGRIFIASTQMRAVALEIACETDFVAKADPMADLGNSLATELVHSGAEALLEAQELKVKEAAALLKENLSVRRIVSYPITAGELVGEYLHSTPTLGVLVMIKTPSAEVAGQAIVRELAKNLAQHVAAYAPAFLDRASVDPAFLEQQTKIAEGQLEELKGKPEAVIQKILQGKIDKQVGAVCLLEQAFIKDESLTVEDHVKSVARALGTELSVTAFAYVKVGQE